MDTEKYLAHFFPSEKPDFFKNGKDSLWNINGDRTMIALAMTFRKEPEAQVMCFMRNYAERYYITLGGIWHLFLCGIALGIFH